MDWTERRERLRSLIAGPRCIYPGSVYDAISARIAEDLGFEAGMFAGSIASFTVLGAPDVVVLTLTEFAQQAYRINRAGKLPLLVDADHGYGNALSVKRTVEELETAGVAALTIEDTALPTGYGASGPNLIPIAEGVGKMKAALTGRQDKRLVIVGRTSAMAMTGVADTIARLKAYEEAGVDMLFMAGVKTRAQLDAVAAAVKLPLFLGSPGPELYAGFFIRLQSRDGVGHPGHRHGAGAAHNDKPLVLPAGQSRLHLADTLGDRDQVRAARAIAGR